MAFSFTIPFFSSWKTHSYNPVPAPDEERLLESPDVKKDSSRGFSSSVFLDPSFWLTTLAILSVAITIRNLLVIQLNSLEPYTEYLEASVARPYTGLEKLSRNESSPSWPLSSILYPDFVGATEGTQVHHTLNNGSVVRMDSERTIVLQHRVRDYGLERCAVKVEFSRKKHKPRVFGHVGESPYLTLWRLEESESKVLFASSPLPMSLPPRKEFLGNITLDAMHPAQSSFFECSAGSVQNLEIAMACASDPCIMEFRLTQSPQRQGFWIVQSE